MFGQKRGCTMCLNLHLMNLAIIKKVLYTLEIENSTLGSYSNFHKGNLELPAWSLATQAASVRSVLPSKSQSNMPGLGQHRWVEFGQSLEIRRQSQRIRQTKSTDCNQLSSRWSGFHECCMNSHVYLKELESFHKLQGQGWLTS